MAWVSGSDPIRSNRQSSSIQRRRYFTEPERVWPQLFQIQGVRDSTPPARLPVARQHPEIHPAVVGPIDEALPVRRQAEGTAAVN
jgi:hypothetical protein